MERMKWETCSAGEKEGHDSLLPLSPEPILTLTKAYVPHPCFFSPCRLTLLLTLTHFWSLSTLRVVGSRGRGEERYTLSSRIKGED